MPSGPELYIPVTVFNSPVVGSLITFVTWIVASGPTIRSCVTSPSTSPGSSGSGAGNSGSGAIVTFKLAAFVLPDVETNVGSISTASVACFVAACVILSISACIATSPTIPCPAIYSSIVMSIPSTIPPLTHSWAISKVSSALFSAIMTPT